MSEIPPDRYRGACLSSIGERRRGATREVHDIDERNDSAMATTAEQMRAHRGPALLTGGFRPFFLFGAVWAAIAGALWLPVFEGRLALPTAMTPLDWHVHELLFGYLGAAVAGFLLTAIPNWTGRLPVVGRPLGLLVGLWMLGRIAVLLSDVIGVAAAGAIDLAFFVALVAVTAREVWAGGNRRNLRVVALVALLALGDLVFLVESALAGTASFGIRIGIAALVLLVSVVGGRIVPSFTINWLRNRGPGRGATPFGRFDGGVIVLSAAVLVLWIARPEAPATAVGLLVAGLAQSARLARWAGWRTIAEPLVLVLHVAYAFLALGFLVLGAALLDLVPVTPSAALHLWTIGALALMTLAVMTRASLGHTGRALRAGPGLRAVYLGAVFATLARFAMGFGHGEWILLHAALFGWLVAFVGFAVLYAPILTRPRL